MVNVIKRGGKKQKFSAEKLRNSVRKAVIDAGFKVAGKKKLIDEVSKETIDWIKEEGEVRTEDITDCILSQLDEESPKVAKSWRKFDRKYKS